MGKNIAGEIYLVDIMERLHFLYADANLKEKNKQLYAFLEKSKQNLLVKSDLEAYRTDADDVTKNLFKVCCAILNMQVNQRGSPILDESLLKTYLEGINFHRDDPELVLIDQLATVKSLINRKAYTLTDRQVAMIHEKFKNMFENRENHLFIKERESFVQQRKFDPKNSAKGPGQFSEKKTLNRQFTEKKPLYYAPEGKPRAA